MFRADFVRGATTTTTTKRVDTPFYFRVKTTDDRRNVDFENELKFDVKFTLHSAVSSDEANLKTFKLKFLIFARLRVPGGKPAVSS